jgi:predicted glycoside hydrolase/deacetylase ChbG (UPF0249 family)
MHNEAQSRRNRSDEACLSGADATAPRQFALIADDFALTARVSAGILDLMAAQRLSGTGAMTNRPAWSEGAVELRALGPAADVGLHVNLTLGAPLGPMPQMAPADRLPTLGTLVAALGRPDAPMAEIEAEIGRQLDAFADRLGRLPDFVDGHQHVHVLPRIRGALLRALLARVPPEGHRPWVRDPFDTPGRILVRGVAVAKAELIAGLSIGFGRAARRAGFATNQGFAGVSPFDPGGDYAAEFRRYLVASGRAHLVMCHPGRDGDAELAQLDPVVGSRPREWAYLASARFREDLAQDGFVVARLADMLRG